MTEDVPRRRPNRGSHRAVATIASVLYVLALLLPPALLLQQQTWVLPATGLGSGLGLTLAVVMVLVSVLLMAANMHPPITHMPPMPILFLGWGTVATWSFFVWSATGLPFLSLFTTVGYAQSIAELLFVIAVMGAVNYHFRHRALVRSLVFCGGLYGLILIITSMTGQEIAPLLRLPFLREGTGLVDIEASRGGFIRPQGMSGHPLEAGAVCTILTPLAVGLARGSRGFDRLWSWPCAALLVLGSLATLSRSATVGLIVALAVMALRWPLADVRKALGVAVMAAAALTIVAADRVLAYLDLFTLSADSDSSLLSRQVARAQAFDVISHHFWGGQGLSSVAALGGRTLDNQLLALAVEQGVPAMLVFIAMIVVPIWGLMHRAPQLMTWEREVAVGLAGSLSALLLCSSILDILGFPQIRLLLYILLALVGPIGMCVARTQTEPMRAACP